MSRPRKAVVDPKTGHSYDVRYVPPAEENQQAVAEIVKILSRVLVGVGK